MLALAADRIYATCGVVRNPDYRTRGLYRSEYWTYTPPRRVGQKRALELTELCQPIGARQAYEMGFLDDAFGNDAKTFEVELRERAVRLAQDPGFRAYSERSTRAVLTTNASSLSPAIGRRN
jgi:putative two-component system protein, hydrogenase maturation factor HypX/HoxX